MDSGNDMRGSRLNILVVCTGNICRSPMAEGILRKICERGLASVSSAGTHALVGNPAAEFSVIAAAEHGIDITPHRAQLLTAAMIGTSDHILCMERSHVEHVLTLAPDAHGRTHNLAEFIGGLPADAIPDPYGCSLREYRECYRTIAAALARFVAAKSLLEDCSDRTQHE
jgi:protein-tyrosine phosphatase